MNKTKDNKKSIMNFISEKNYHICHGNSVEKIKMLEDNSIKLIYGSPPYPNAKRKL
jgi:DNA modification methylase